MRKSLAIAATLALLCLSLTGCAATDEKTVGLWIVYAGTVFFSALFELVYCLNKNMRDRWYLLLFSSVLVVNLGYLLLSVSGSVEMALHANRLAYLGSVCLPLSFLMIIMNTCKIQYAKWLPKVLIGLAVLVFLITASPGILGIYYKKVWIEQLHGITVLNKVYGPLHPFYAVYLLGYFSAMLVAIFYAVIKRRVTTPAYSVILAAAVFINICVWLVEKFISVEFELLSVSYIITELFLLGLNYLIVENEKQAKKITAPAESKPSVDPELQAKLDFFSAALPTLTQKELDIFECYVQGMSTQEVLAHLDIKENTLKFHNKNIYNKLGVANRRQLVEFHKMVSHPGA
jgi:DNA-binding CsgD family transcriptional regulator